MVTFKPVVFEVNIALLHSLIPKSPGILEKRSDIHCLCMCLIPQCSEISYSGPLRAGFLAFEAILWQILDQLYDK